MTAADIVARLRAAAERQDAFANRSVYRHISEEDARMFRHAANMLRMQADAIEREEKKG